MGGAIAIKIISIKYTFIDALKNAEAEFRIRDAQSALGMYTGGLGVLIPFINTDQLILIMQSNRGSMRVRICRTYPVI